MWWCIVYLEVGLSKLEIVSKLKESIVSILYDFIIDIGAGQGPFYQRAVSNHIHIGTNQQ